ncbi:hypothetical protein SBADM41S_09425 [Streptomyces badius]
MDLSVRRLFETPTVAGLVAERQPVDAGGALARVLPLRAAGGAAPLFCIHPGGGVLSWCYTRLLPHLPQDVPVYGIQARGLDGAEPLATSVTDMAAEYAALLRGVQPRVLPGAGLVLRRSAGPCAGGPAGGGGRRGRPAGAVGRLPAQRGPGAEPDATEIVANNLRARRASPSTWPNWSPTNAPCWRGTARVWRPSGRGNSSWRKQSSCG